MGNQNRRARSHNLAQIFENLFLCPRIHAGQCIVHNQNPRLSNHRARNSCALFLSPRKRDPALSHNRLQLLGKKVQIGSQLRNLGRAHNIALCPRAQSHIFPNRIRKQKRILRHIPGRVSNGLKRYIFHRLAIDKNPPFIRLDQPGDQPRQRGFSRPHAPHHGECTSRWNPKIDIFEHALPIVRKTRVAKFDLPSDIPRCATRHIGLRRYFQNLFNTPQRSHSALILIDNSPQHRHRPTHTQQIRIERHKCPQAQTPLNHPQTAQPQNHNHRNTAQQKRERIIQTANFDQMAVARDVFFIENPEIHNLERAHGKGFDHSHTRQIFLNF